MAFKSPFQFKRCHDSGITVLVLILQQENKKKKGGKYLEMIATASLPLLENSVFKQRLPLTAFNT